MRCDDCQMFATLCICDLIPQLTTRTRLLLVMHYREARKPTNSGRIAARALVGSEVWIRGEADALPTALAPDDTRQPLLLFPAEDARPITDFANSAKPVTLIVPDGTWRQASKVRTRVTGMRDVPCATLPPDEPTAYRLRSEPVEGGLATLEAIARAFGILESPAIRTALEAVFRVMVERSLWLRGALPAAQVTGGIPAAALAQRGNARRDEQ